MSRIDGDENGIADDEKPRRSKERKRELPTSPREVDAVKRHKIESGSFSVTRKLDVESVQNTIL